MLAGEPPFTGRTNQIILARHLADAVPPLRTVCPAISPSLERVILQSLEKDPARRLQSAALFAQALEAEQE
jgi:serine/threonine-protein kinase